MMVPRGGPSSLHPFVRAPAATAPEAKSRGHTIACGVTRNRKGRWYMKAVRQLRRLVQGAVWRQEEVGVRSGLPKPGSRPAPRVDRPQADGEERGRGRGETLRGAAEGQRMAREAFAAPPRGFAPPRG